MSTGAGRSALDWVSIVVDGVILLTCVLYLSTDEFWALVLWESVAAAYLLIGFIIAWGSRAADNTDPEEARAASWWMWIPPVLSAFVGVNAAITALVARDGGYDVDRTAVMLAASAGVILSWMLLHVGFADAYRVIAASADDVQVRFPQDSRPTVSDYLYFAFTIGTAFSTSDVEVIGQRTRRVVLVHSVVAFFYNALVVAVAFQILQDLVVS